MPKEESQSDDKKGKKKGKKGKHAEEEEKEVVVYPNPFDELGPSWLKRRDFLATMASQREYLDNVEPKTESAHVLRAERDRRPSLPDRLEAPVSDALGTCLGGDPDDDPLHGAKGVATPEIDHFLPMKLYKEPSLTRERRLSNIVSRSEQTARELRAILTERAELEKGDEATIQSKLSFWDAGHEQYKLDMTGKTLMKDDFYFLCYALRFNYMIKSLDLSKCFVTDRDMIDICENMEMNRCTDELSLRQTKVGDDGAHALLKLFKLNNTLTRLDMRQTSLTGDGGQMLVEACTINRNLTMLNGLDLPDLRAHPPDVADFSEHYFGAPDVVILHDLFAGESPRTKVGSIPRQTAHRTTAPDRAEPCREPHRLAGLRGTRRILRQQYYCDGLGHQCERGHAAVARKGGRHHRAACACRRVQTGRQQDRGSPEVS
jgi:hypothetical protein